MNIFIEYLKVFISGGILCAIAQILIDKTRLTPARILVSYVVAGVILTGVGIYEPLTEFANSGATVPLTGFGYALAKGVQRAVDEKGIIGAFTGGLTATSAGICAVIMLGLICALVFRSREKNR